MSRLLKVNLTLGELFSVSVFQCSIHGCGKAHLILKQLISYIGHIQFVSNSLMHVEDHVVIVSFL